VVFQICEDVLAAELSAQPESITSRVERALKYLADSRRCRLAVHSKDFEYVQRELESLEQAGGIALQLAVDDRLERGAARLETESVVLEASIASHLSAIREHFLVGKDV